MNTPNPKLEFKRWPDEQATPRIWRSTCGRYFIVAVTLPENPPRTMYQARRVDQTMASAYPLKNDMGILLDESPWCWNLDNSVHSAEAACIRDAWVLANRDAMTVPDDYPAVAMNTFWFPYNSGSGSNGRGALSIEWRDGHLYARLLCSSRKTETDTEIVDITEIDLTALGVTADPQRLVTTTDHGAQCCGCNVKVGQPHREGCDWAKCLVTGEQRALCTTFGESRTAGIEALTTGTTDEFEMYFKTPLEHDCGEDVFRG